MEKPILIPKKLEKDLLLNSVIEIRFLPQGEKGIVFSKLINIFSKEFTSLIEPALSTTQTMQLQFKHASYPVHITLKNEEFSVGIGVNTIVFNCVNGYKGWGKYFNLVQKYLRLINSEGIFSKIERVGIRYINFFETKNNLSTDILLDIEYANRKSYEAKRTTLRTELRKAGFTFIITASDNIRPNILANPATMGSLIDIDVITSDLKYQTLDELFNIINDAHIEEKNIFFGFLRQEFINELKPTY